MAHPQNYRAYGILKRNGLVLVAAEYVSSVFVWKFPGGGVYDLESAEEATIREFVEEAGMSVRIVREVLDPGTLISPWTGKPYTPIFFLVESDDEPVVPATEEVELTFKSPQEFLASNLAAAPEKTALKIVLDEAS